MKSARKLLLSAAVAAALVHASPAFGWDSVCFRFKDPTMKVGKLVLDQTMSGGRNCEGIEGARGRWRDPDLHVDEHRHIFKLSALKAGLPAAVLETQNLPVLTAASTVLVSGANGPTRTVDVRLPGVAAGGAVRSFALDELAQLPDVSYTLWDYARGNETCPLPLTGPLGEAQACHTFSSHMGATNSNHFPPQSDEWYAHYHTLAMTRADECRAQRNAVWNAEPASRRAATDARMAPFFKACEVEALAYEAVGQHYLQDSWSAGHAWQRWGSTSLIDFPLVGALGDGTAAQQWNAFDPNVKRLLVAEIVAISAGTIHGSDPGLYGVLSPLPPWMVNGVSLHDAMCYPDADVMARKGNSLFQMAGDVHLHDVIPEAWGDTYLPGELPTHEDTSFSELLPYSPLALSVQAHKLVECTMTSIGEVYAKLSDQATFKDPVLGACKDPQTGGACVPVAFDADKCRAPVATNSAIAAGLDMTYLQPAVGESQKVLEEMPWSIILRARADYTRLLATSILVSAKKPDGTELSTLRLDDEVDDGTVPLYTMMHTLPNRCHSVAGGVGCSTIAGSSLVKMSPLPDFIDPQVGQTLAPLDPGTMTREWALALFFHTSRASQLCGAMTQSALDGLPGLVAAAQDPKERDAACEACAEWTLPFLRIGTGPGAPGDEEYDVAAEPLCHFASANIPDPGVVYAYEPANGSSDPMTLARRHCGCGVGLIAVTEAGVQRIDKDTLDPDGPTVPIGTTLPRDLALASRGRILVSTGQGNIMCVNGDQTVDLDGEPANGDPCITFPSNGDGTPVSDVRGIAVSNVAGKELLLAASANTGELLVYDLDAKELCQRVTVTFGGSPRDVAVSADATKVWVSVYGGLAGLVELSLPALATCDPGASVILGDIAPPNVVAGLGPLALSPDGSKLAIGGRYAGMCPDLVTDSWGLLNADVQVGCDRVFVMNTSDDSFEEYDGAAGLPTRPGRFPYANSWFADSQRMAYATYQGIDTGLGNGTSGWPMNSPEVYQLPVGGTLRLASTLLPIYHQSVLGFDAPRFWTYNMPLQGNVLGETVVVDGGGIGQTARVFVGTASGRLAAYPVTAMGDGLDPMWEQSEGDPDSLQHNLVNGNWYGGCTDAWYSGSSAVVCPSLPSGTTPPGFAKQELYSPIRILATY